MPANLSVIEGTAVTTTVTFQNPGVSDPVDPTTITLKWAVTVDATYGSVTTWTYGGTGSVVRDDVGIYSAELTTASTPGLWTVEWLGTGACAAVETATFLVTSQPF